MNKKIKINDATVSSKIYRVRGQKIMIDEDLAQMYNVPTKRLNEQVRRNMARFPKDFMFQLTEREFENLKSQFATSSWGGRRTLPYAFTEHGVLMLSSVLNSETAIQVNIRIVRVYAKLRDMLAANKDIMLKLEQLEHKINMQGTRVRKNEEEIYLIFEALKKLLNPPKEPMRRVGY